jgi:CheY-like chemotaxis protein
MLLDLALPGLDGYNAARVIRRAPWGADITIVAVSGFGTEEDKQRCWEAGIDHHFTKPVEPARLAQLVVGSRPSGRKLA